MHAFTCWWGGHYVGLMRAWEVTVEGREHIDPDRTYVLAPNHQSALDILLLFRIQRHFKWISKREAFKLFEELLNNIKYEVIRFLSKVQIRTEQEIEEMERQQREAQERERQNARYMHEQTTALAAGEESAEEEPPRQAAPFVREGRKIGRNEPCPCGSGKKFKQCHGQLS